MSAKWASRRKTYQSAFTIVELLIVVVVIGILAAVTVITFNGVQSKARVAGLQSTLESSLKQIENARTTAGTNTYPTTAPTELPSGVTYYANANLGGFCASKTDSSLTYMITSTSTVPHAGPSCTATNLTNLVTNPSFETSNANWVAAGTNTITRSTAYSANGAASGLVARTGTAGSTTVSIPMTTVVGTQYFVSYALRNVVGTSTITASVRNTSATGTIPADSSS
ncbi:MAG: prepilin-type N-terminal cleavage/methylation domain-containing protein [Candidatus Microsaccharimonas sossegonensis]|uniref:Prepilin-type N-terminal cleavage/methylation domain-containing protein n=1 Tax=Candidatus Microsaccharimonas sossegonensis TaxID=2506948 RepID=A0A4Q0AIS8_9BACT|nr:MAG: prepilin-type N-terminal cleavage/methylation domain-containing protein [Candidatus Microsaccharimonas sossegonensis]